MAGAGDEILLEPDRPARFTLGQPWRDEPEPLLRPTVVDATFRDGRLVVAAELVDDDVFNDAVTHNSATWETGDVFEIFARRDDEEAYVEVHVTPDDVKLHLRFDDFAHHRRIADLREVAADPAAIVSRASRTAQGWQVAAELPLRASVGELIRVSFCRYDATRGRREPVLSTSSPHPVVAFHRPWEWRLCRIGQARPGS